MDAERELMTMLVKNRDQLREYRRGYYEALFANDARRAAKIEREYQQRFGHRIPVSEKDIEAVQKRRQVTRLEQLILTLPPEERAPYINLIAATYGKDTAALIGVSPEALGTPGSQGGRTREKSRAQTGAGGTAPYVNQMGPLEKVPPYGIGKQRPAPQSPLGL